MFVINFVVAVLAVIIAFPLGNTRGKAKGIIASDWVWYNKAYDAELSGASWKGITIPDDIRKQIVEDRKLKAVK
jgi:hypothetical protein